MALLEIACFNPQSALVAAQAGADRIELCDNVDFGGTTPPLEWLSQIQGKVSVPIYAMVRPRAGVFVYTEQELTDMRNSVHAFKSSDQVSGFVFGFLKHDDTVDVEKTTEFVKLAAPLPCTFHRAFDVTPNPLAALEDVIQCGIKTILTSGGAPNAVHGCDMLAQLVKNAGGRVTIMPGGGVRSTNIDMLQTKTSAVAYHSAALIGDEFVASDQEIKKLKYKLQQGP